MGDNVPEKGIRGAGSQRKKKWKSIPVLVFTSVGVGLLLELKTNFLNTFSNENQRPTLSHIKEQTSFSQPRLVFYGTIQVGLEYIVRQHNRDALLHLQETHSYVNELK
jgi:hypothetical protein